MAAPGSPGGLPALGCGGAEQTVRSWGLGGLSSPGCAVELAGELASSCHGQRGLVGASLRSSSFTLGDPTVEILGLHRSISRNGAPRWVFQGYRAVAGPGGESAASTSRFSQGRVLDPQPRAAEGCWPAPAPALIRVCLLGHCRRSLALKNVPSSGKGMWGAAMFWVLGGAPGSAQLGLC